jgi:hypothetical protein
MLTIRKYYIIPETGMSSLNPFGEWSVLSKKEIGAIDSGTLKSIKGKI